MLLKFNRRFTILFFLTLFFVQGCSLKNSNNVENLEQDKSINELSSESDLDLSPSPIRNNRQFDHSDSWQHLISLFAIPEVDDALIQKQLDWYLARPKYIATIQTRAEPYLYNIIKQVEEKGLPGELALLPAVESGFKAHAYSRARARVYGSSYHPRAGYMDWIKTGGMMAAVMFMLLLMLQPVI